MRRATSSLTASPGSTELADVSASAHLAASPCPDFSASQFPPPPFTAELTVERYLSGVRIDSFLLKHFRNYSPFRMQRMICAGNASINGIVVELDTRVFPGQHIRMQLVEPPDKLLEPEPLPLDILYEDAWLIVVNKPAGQISHPVGIYQSGTLSNALQHHFDAQTELRGLLRPGIVHRIDRMTSGVLIIAKEHLAHRRLSIGFQRALFKKEYVAIVEGRMVNDEGTIDAPIGRLPGGGSILMSTDPAALGAREAVTHFRVTRRFENATLVAVAPETGRNHQIRVHLASIGHPVLDDEYYGPFGEIRKLPRSAHVSEEIVNSSGNDGNSGEELDDASDMEGRHALHASRLNFDHPITHVPMSVEAPLPEDMRAIIDEMASARVRD